MRGSVPAYGQRCGCSISSPSGAIIACRALLALLEPLRARRQNGNVVPWLRSTSLFPPIDAALDDPNGLLAAGGDLRPERLLAAYRHGIFPWYNESTPILWWSPDPRMVLFVGEFKL